MSRLVESGNSCNIEDSITDLDSHTNAIGIGRFVIILSNTRRTTEFRPFSPEYESFHKGPIVGDAMQNNTYV